MATDNSLQYDIEIETINSSDIASVAAELGATHARQVAEAGEGDNRIVMYALPHPHGHEILVAGTNGQPVWEEATPEDFWRLCAPMALASALRSMDDLSSLTGWPIIDGCLVPEPDKWQAADEGAEITVDACSAQDAAETFVDGGTWDTSEGTTWITVSAWRNGIDTDGDKCYVGRDTITIALDPDEPACIDTAGHDWRAPYDIVGGIKENPGVWGHGGGVTMRECCLRCGCGKFTDTWAQNPATGEQGLHSVSYTEGEYSEHVEAAR